MYSKTAECVAIERKGEKANVSTIRVRLKKVIKDTDLRLYFFVNNTFSCRVYNSDKNYLVIWNLNCRNEANESLILFLGSLFANPNARIAASH